MVPEVILGSRGSAKRGPPSVCVCALYTYQRSTILRIFLFNLAYGEVLRKKDRRLCVCTVHIHIHTTSDFPPKNWHGKGRNVILLGNSTAGKLCGGFGSCFSSL